MRTVILRQKFGRWWPLTKKPKFQALRNCVKLLLTYSDIFMPRSPKTLRETIRQPHKLQQNGFRWEAWTVYYNAVDILLSAAKKSLGASVTYCLRELASVSFSPFDKGGVGQLPTLSAAAAT